MPYDEAYRPQFHYTTPAGFLGDPVMMVHYAGEYHLGYAWTDPVVQSGPAYWRHAVSPDLLHWNELPVAVEPDPGHECGIWSGGAVVDWKNTSGLQTGAEKVLVAIYTKVKHGFCLVYSNDRGRTWTKHPGNPVMPSVAGWNDRDTSIFWHEPTGRWVMLITESGLTRMSFYGSPDLKHWEPLSSVDGFRVDCPDIFDLPVDGDSARRKWVLWASFFNPYVGRYIIGDFDGTRFTKESGIVRLEWGHSFAARTWRDAPDGRTIQVGFLNGGGGRLPDMPFGNQISIPCELSLKTFEDGIRMCAWPVREVESLRTEVYAQTDVVLADIYQRMADVPSGLVDIEAEFELIDAAEFGLNVRGEAVAYNTLDRLASVHGSSGPLDPVNGRIRLRILADRMSIEVFGNGGRMQMMDYYTPAPHKEIAVYSFQGSVRVISLKMYELKSSMAGLL